MKQQGYVLVSLLLILFLLASVSLILNREGGMSVQLAADEKSISEATQVALAGMNHVLWRAEQADCEAYTDLAQTTFGNHSYVATISPTSGSPVHVLATATLSDGSSASVERFSQVIYQPPKTLETITTADGSGKDTRVSNYWLTQGNHGSAEILYSTGVYLGSESFAMFQFDLSMIPSNIVITEATFSLYFSDIEVNSSDAEIAIKRMTHDWTEDGASYSTSDGSTAWSYPPPMDTAVYDSIPVEATATGVHNWDITALVNQWIRGTVPNYGLVLDANDAVRIVDLESKEKASPNLIPTLTFRYTCECGVYCDTFVPLPVAVAHWTLDETSGTTANDSISDNHGTTHTISSPWDTGQIGGSASFNGFTDYIEVPHDADLSFNDELAISAWFRLEASATGPFANQTIIGKGTTGFTEEYWFGVWENELEFGILDSGNWYGVSTAGLALVPDRWYHAAVTFSDQSNEVRIYLDGVLRRVGEISIVNLTTDNEDVHIGQSQYGEFFYGNLDDIRLFDYLITPEEVEALTINGGLTPESAESVEDWFNDEAFNGSDGSLAWTNDWQEVGEGDGAISGDIRILSEGERNFVARLRDNDNGGEGIERQANISMCSTAQLAFEYKRVGLDSFNDYVAVQISSDGGTNWDELDRLTGFATDFSYNPAYYDISAYIGSDVRIRFITSPTMGGGDTVYIDNVQLFLTGCS